MMTGSRYLQPKARQIDRLGASNNFKHVAAKQVIISTTIIIGQTDPTSPKKFIDYILNVDEQLPT